MTYNEFKKKYNGKYVDHDGQHGAQCWDLAQKYFIECLNLPENILGGCEYISNMLKEPKLSLMKQYFDIIPLNQKEPGDVEIFDWGHIAIMDHWDASQGVNYYFTQNTGSASNPVGPAYVGALYDNESCVAFRIKKKYAPKAKTNTAKNEEKKVQEETNSSKEINTLKDKISFLEQEIEAKNKELKLKQQEIEKTTKERDYYKGLNDSFRKFIAAEEDNYFIHLKKNEKLEYKKS